MQPKESAQGGENEKGDGGSRRLPTTADDQEYQHLEETEETTEVREPHMNTKARRSVTQEDRETNRRGSRDGDGTVEENQARHLDTAEKYKEEGPISRGKQT